MSGIVGTTSHKGIIIMNHVVGTLIACMVLAAGCAQAVLAQDHSADEQAIRQNVARYLEAFRNRDVAALAALWAPDAIYVSSRTGDRLQGREAIQRELESVFAEDENVAIDVSVSSIRFLTHDVAVEEGVARVTRGDEPPSRTTYSAIHVKRDGQWLLDSIRETELPSPPSNFEYLESLDWMVGEWVDEDENARIETRCQWTKNKNFLTRSFTVEIEGRIELEGTQVIGWDAANGRIRSWVFDSDGGFGEGNWSQQGDRWVINGKATLPDGRTGSSVFIITKIDNDSFTWQSVSREVDGEILPNVEPVTIVRKPVEESQ
jgi:uncharacterized protein (TIGR02246 family)